MSTSPHRTCEIASYFGYFPGSRPAWLILLCLITAKGLSQAINVGQQEVSQRKSLVASVVIHLSQSQFHRVFSGHHGESKTCFVVGISSNGKPLIVFREDQKPGLSLHWVFQDGSIQKWESGWNSKQGHGSQLRRAYQTFFLADGKANWYNLLNLHAAYGNGPLPTFNCWLYQVSRDRTTPTKHHFIGWGLPVIATNTDCRSDPEIVKIGLSLNPEDADYLHRSQQAFMGTGDPVTVSPAEAFDLKISGEEAPRIHYLKIRDENLAVNEKLTPNFLGITRSFDTVTVVFRETLFEP